MTGLSFDNSQTFANHSATAFQEMTPEKYFLGCFVKHGRTSL